MASQPGHPLHLEDNFLVVGEVMVERLPTSLHQLSIAPQPRCCTTKLGKVGALHHSYLYQNINYTGRRVHVLGISLLLLREFLVLF
jgi:hypothetical protein